MLYKETGETRDSMAATSFQYFLLVVGLFSVHWWQRADGTDIYVLDDSTGVGRVFDGIGGLSGGGVIYSLTFI